MSPASRRRSIEQWRRFLLAESHILSLRPDLLFQQAANQPASTAPARVADRWGRGRREGRPWLRCLTTPLEPDPCLATFRHGYLVSACAFSPDGEHVLSASFDGTLKVWSAWTGRKEMTLRGHTDRVRACAFSPDGGRIVSGSDDRTLRIWDTHVGTERTVFRGHVRDVTACVFSPDGEGVVSGSADGTLYVWDARTGTERTTWTVHADAVTCLNLSGDGSRLVSGCRDGTLEVRDLGAGRRISTLRGHTRSVTACAFLFGGRMVASASEDGTIRLWDVERGEAVKVLDRRHPVSACAFAPGRGPDDPFRLAYASGITLLLWGSRGGVLGTHPREIIACSFSPDRARVVSAGGLLKVWDAAAGGRTGNRKHGGRIEELRFSPDGDRIVSASWKALRLWCGRTGREVAQLDGGPGWVWACAFDPSSRWLIAGLEDGQLKMWHALDGRDRWTLPGHASAIRTCLVSPDGSRILSTAREDPVPRLWDLENGREVAGLSGHGGRAVPVCAFSPDGARALSVSSSDRTLRIWEAASGAEIGSRRLHPASEPPFTFSPDARALLSRRGDLCLALRDFEHDRDLALLDGYFVGTWMSAFTPDGNRIVTVREDELSVWDTVTARATAILRSPGRVNAFDVSPDGSRVAAAAGGGAIPLWEIESGREIGRFDGPLEATTLAWSPAADVLAVGTLDGHVFLSMGAAPAGSG